VSMTSRNKKRIKALESRLTQTIAKQHDTDDLLIPAYLDEDFLSVKPSIADGYGCEITTDGAYIIIPTFTCALHPLGHKKIAISRETCFFPIKKTARQALLVDYFKPLKGYDLNKKIKYRKTLMEVQVETILLDSGKDELTPPGMRSVKEYFSIFASKARVRRKKMTKTVLKKLKESYLGNKESEKETFQFLPQAVQKEYITKIRAHLDLCKTAKCLETRKNTAAFFLAAIMAYLKNNPVKSKIILHLVKDEIDAQQNKENSFQLENIEIAQLFPDEKTDAFELFRYLALQILANPSSPQIEKFINEHPTIYDPVADIFISHKIKGDES